MSKLIHQQKDFFSKMAVDAVLSLDSLLPLNMIGIKQVQGGALEVRCRYRYRCVGRYRFIERYRRREGRSLPRLRSYDRRRCFRG